MANFLRGVREWATPVLQESAFIERGVLTPEEFVAAGDQLVYRCPTWQWEAGEPGKRRNHLPADKQFLVTRRVPCRERASALSTAYTDERELSADGEGGGEDGWLDTHIMTVGAVDGAARGGTAAGGAAEDETLETIGGGGLEPAGGAAPATRPPDGEEEGMIIGEGGSTGGLNLAGAIVDDGHFVTQGGGSAAAPATDAAAADADAAGAQPEPAGDAATDVVDAAVEDEYEDLATFEEENIQEPDEATLAPSAGYMVAQEPEDNVVHTRVYDLSISYDKYYQTPRVWLFGYDEVGQPLTPEQTFEDVIQDYARQTVTIDPHPHLSQHHASVHPCKHSNVMKRIVDNLIAGGAQPRTDQYLFIFLKFIGSVVPTIEYDYTMEVSAS